MTALYVVPLVVLLIVGGSWGVGAYQTNRAEARAYGQAEQALAEGRLLDAESLFGAAGGYANAPQRQAETAAQIAPYVAKYEDGEAALKAGDYDAAVELFLPVAVAIPDYGEVGALLAEAQLGQANALKAAAQRAYAAQDWLLAEQLFTKLHAELPNDADVAATLLDLRSTHALFVYTLRKELMLAVPGSTAPIPVTDAVTASWPVWSPDRSRIAFISPGDANNGFARALYVVDPDGSNLKRLGDAPVQNQLPVWSPDGTRIAFVVDQVTAQHTSMRTSIVVVDIATGKSMEVAARPLPNASSPTWSPTGDRIAFVSRAIETPAPLSPAPRFPIDRSSVYVYDFASGATTRIGGDDLPDPYQIVWSPTADRLLVFSRQDGTPVSQGRLFMVDMDANTVITIDGTNIDVSLPVWSPDGTRFAYVVRTSWIRIVTTDGQAFSLPTTVNLDGEVTWSPSGDRLLAAGSTGIGLAALAVLTPTDGTIGAIPLVYDADGGDAGPPDWAGLRGSSALALVPAVATPVAGG